MSPSRGSVCATAFSFRQIGVSRISGISRPGMPTDLRKAVTASPRRSSAMACRIAAQSACVVARLPSTISGAS